MGRTIVGFFLLAACTPPGAGRVGDGPSDGSGTGSSTVPDPTGPTGTTTGAPTWYQDVAPLVADRCGACHVPGGIGPMSFATYGETLPWGGAIADALAAGTMPPFFASDDDVCEEKRGFLDDIRLSDAEKQLVYDWVDAGMPEGDPATAAPAPLREVESLETWNVELELHEPFEVAGNDDIYQCFRLELPNAEDVWITGLEVIPDATAVVHHVLVWNDPFDNSAGKAGEDGTYGCTGFPDILPTELVAAWTPGAQPVRSPPGTGTLLKGGASLVLNIHYHPGAGPEVDRTKIRVQWTEEQPAQYTTWYLVDLPFGASMQPGPSDQGGPEFRIPPDVPDHLETEELWLPPLLFPEMPIFAVAPHMHYLGVDQLVTLDHGDPAEEDECLVHTPGFRFDFQQGYAYDPKTGDLPVWRPGDRIRVQCMYDNSTANPFMPLHLEASNATAPHEVRWGEETGDEMCMVMVGLIIPPVDWMELFSWF